ncbi:helix-turn-helix transcriptional regulator [Amycolatopsis decaplanina]|uniref:LuxR family transcriptional regulator n=1 Tax=Amycolatopsis decaplanina DSM 44594 TaxID=1284240 RepID=M2YCF5_9PSEU|nr:helix-turn-helix transcriptional regulator [Amycolatopsis decaplanina]EME52537.1 LuxR family transcriptional regulator [Amycolatopsis decaplanina DSM 44594]
MTTEVEPTPSLAGTSMPRLSPEAIRLYHQIVLNPGILGADTTRGRDDDTSEAIAQLAESGLVRPAPGNGWEAVNPGLAVDALARRTQHVLVDHLLQISALGRHFTLLHGVDSERGNGSATLFEPVATEHEAHAFLAEHLRTGPQNLFACSGGPGPGFADCGVGALLTPALIPPGRQVHLVLPHGSTLRPQFTEHRAIRVRSCRQIPLTAVAAGPSAGALALPASGPSSPARRFFVYQHPAAHAVVKTLLDSLWSFSVPLHAQIPPPAGIHRAIVGLLAMGKKDENIARHLGLGLRTTRKHIADILKTLGARSRLEAGVLAERNGWLDPPAETTEGRL